MPIDLGSTRFTGIALRPYLEVRKKLGLPDNPPRVFDLIQMHPEVELSVIDRLGVDVVGVFPLKPSWDIKINAWKDWRFADGVKAEVPEGYHPVKGKNGDLYICVQGKRVAKMPDNGFYYDALLPPPAFEIADFPKPEDVSLPPLLDEDFEFMQRRSNQLHQETDKAVIGSLEGLYLMPDGLRFEDWWTALYAEKSYSRDCVNRKADLIIETLKPYSESVGGDIFAVAFGEDFGTQRGEIFSPEVFREIYFPAYQRVFSWIHENTPWKVFMHSCGSVANLIDMFIESGVDILNPVQTNAANMDPRTLKRRFGQRITFWGGGVETQDILPFGTPRQVEDQVRKRLRIFGPGGGFVFAPVHNIQCGTPAENVLAAFGAAREDRMYPVDQEH